MKTKVTKNGVNVPLQMLEGAEEVEIRKEKGRVIVIPLAKQDPIVSLGDNPVPCNASDASEQHDIYLYDPHK